MPVKYESGDLFAIPLEGGGIGVALIARRAHERTPDTIFCYGFDRVFEEVPLIHEVDGLRITDAVAVTICLDSSIRSGRWSRVGALPDFRPDEWPVPPMSVPIIGSGGRFPDDPQRQWLCIVEDRYLREVKLPRVDFVDETTYLQLPRDRGLGNEFYLEASLDRAVRKRHHLHYVSITEETVGKWIEIIDRVRRAGLYPEAIPRDPPSPSRAKRNRKSR